MSHSELSLWGVTAQALAALDKAERELQRLRECLLDEVKMVTSGLERAIHGAQREEHRLVERVEQDHRDAQRRLEQLQRDNNAAARVGRSLLDQRLHQLANLREQIQKRLSSQTSPDQDVLVQNISQLLQPWEVALSLKRVDFRPNSQPKPVAFGQIHIQEISLNFPVGACGVQERHCPLHSVEGLSRCAEEEQLRVAQSTNSPAAGMKLRVVRKIHLSSRREEDSTEKELSSQKLQRWPPLQVLSNGESEEEEQEKDNDGDRGEESAESFIKTAVLTGSYKPSDIPEVVPRSCSRGTMTSRQHSMRNQTCWDSSCRQSPCCHMSLCLDDYSHQHSSGRGRTSSTTDSTDSSYTLPIKLPLDYSGSPNGKMRLSRSTVDLSRRNLSPTSRHKTDKFWSAGRHCLSPTSFTVEPKALVSMAHGDASHQNPFRVTPGQVCRSLSLSAIERGREAGEVMSSERAKSAFREEVRGDRCPLEAGRLLRQFGKQGSGRADLALPSGVHATPQGQLFVVDCGNARVQVMDLRGNVLQQVFSSGSNSSARRCRNYFDVAVNAKGLIALSCAAERALLIFNRHGRCLQTFGGSALAVKDKLEAPRGVTVTHLDQFLVTDIRRGTLFALKLDPRTGSALERTEIRGFHRPYLVAASLSTGLVAVSERGAWRAQGGQAPCVKVLDPSWTLLRILGVCPGMGPVLSCPWGVCIDEEGNVLVADWGKQHQVVMYPAQGAGLLVVTQGLSSPRGLALLPEGHLVVSDSMHHCIKIFQYK
ncbi:tripartite motif-containing protein 3 [Arapaima gigas]